MKLLIVILIISIVSSLISCVSTREIREKDEMRTTLESDKRFFLYTDDKEIYYFESPYSYQLLNDTLIGVGRCVVDNPKVKTRRVKIELNHIQKLDVEEVDGMKTVLGVGAVGGIVYIIYYLIDSSLNNMKLLGDMDD